MHAATLDRGGQHRQAHLHRVSQRELVRRRRANIFFMLVLATGVTAFLAATTKANSMVYAFALSFMSLCGYCYKLVQIRSLEVDRDADDQLVQRRLNRSVVAYGRAARLRSPTGV